MKTGAKKNEINLCLGLGLEMEAVQMDFDCRSLPSCQNLLKLLDLILHKSLFIFSLVNGVEMVMFASKPSGG